jgi:hypothetical protein
MAGYVLAIPVHWAITLVGWRGAVAVWGAAVLALVPVVWWAYPARLGLRAAGASGTAIARVGDAGVRQIVCSLPFAMLMILFTIAPFVGYLATTQHAVYAESIGFSAWEASLMLMIGGVLSTAGRALAGLSCDRLGAPLSAFLSYGTTLVGTLCLVGLDLVPSRVLAYAYVAFVFLPLGTRATIVSVLVSRIAPPAVFGTIFGLLAIGNNLGAGAGPLLSGLIFDLTQSYLAVYVTAVGFVALAIAALIVFVRTVPAETR